ncbi:MAG: peptidase S41 [Oleiphilus sp.]|nr:MAG: peptidase S41 [Oleiphilus sp.]
MTPRLLTTALICAALSSFTFADTPDQAPESKDNIAEPATDAAPTGNQEPLPLPLDSLRKFADVFGKIKQDYVEEIDDVTLLNYAIRGMLADLDPHSAYLEPSAFTDLKENTTGSFGGLGIEVGMENGFVKVIAPIDDTPAAKGGVEAGDLIIQLDETPVKGMSLSKAVEMMRGEAGTSIVLTILRAKEREPIKIKLVRDDIQVTSVKTVNLDESYGYIRITQFQAQTGEDFANGLKTLSEKADKLTGLIIDLRNNPGGVLQAAVDVADQLLEEGLIVYTEGRSSVSELSYSATPGDSTNGMPIVVLIDGGSASASEILAGALQDHDRAVIMGTQSFGKGSVQNVMSLGDDYALKLTTARYFTPNGRSIQAQGIEPDIEVNRAKLSDEKQQNTYREADLAGHLSNGKENEAEQEEQNQDSEEARIKDILQKDFQLQEALNLLKAIDILNIKYGSNKDA